MLLLACPNCSRQYNATGLEPGSEVRCYCDEVFYVKWPRTLSAEALRCTNCGGSIGVEDKACSYCSASISEADRRQSTLCPGCFTRIEDDSKHCRSCALEIRPQMLSPLPAHRACPRCEGKLRVRSFGSLDVTECAGCLGIWLTPETFKGVTDQAKTSSGETEHLILGKGSEQREKQPDEMRYIPCLVCSELMQRRQYSHNKNMSGTIIDMCRGHGVWLDHQEIERILEFLATVPSAPPPANKINASLFMSEDQIMNGRRRQSLGTSTGFLSRRVDSNGILDFLVNLLFGF